MKYFVVNKWTVLGVCMLMLGWFSLFSSSYLSCGMCMSYSIWVSDISCFTLSILLDWCSTLFLSVVLIISGSVFIYCSWYMSDEVYYNRFMGLVFLFVVSMISLLFISDLISLLLGWDGLGVTSFCLVVYYQNNKSLGAGMVTALTNRIGDVFILFSISLLSCEGSWVLYNFELVYKFWVVGLLLVLASVTKSAQMPFSSWLPAAMAAPTPVSSLVHSSTLVTAGVYLLYRSYSVIGESSDVLDVLKIMSIVTLVMAGSSALMEMDLKKIIALSTLSQLSMMMFSLSIGSPYVGFFHLISHATFKALLFLCAGVIIHTSFGFQDVRMTSQSWRSLPFSSSCLMVANLSLCGCPFLSGFFSKDLIIEVSLCAGDVFLVYFLLLLGTLFTSLYSFRMSMFVLFSTKKVPRCLILKESVVVKVSYVSLLFMAISSGYVFMEVFSYFVESVVVTAVESYMILVLIIVSLVIYESYVHSNGVVNYTSVLSYFFGSMWGLKVVFSHYIPVLSLKGSGYVVKSVEKGWLEKWGPMGFVEVFSSLANFNQKVQSFSFVTSFYFVGVLFFFLIFFMVYF
uniref:NADH dehydrogenase subunit 5 n=1 Tax=Vignadula atrata TaxID=1289577 RepID=UPI001FA7D64E|nr:NADH dehydrogenase subunit 5 [Vignadula atrata]ULT46700.1 NADH dehydrogenase subunit 5 [Vignadula atrata]